MIRERLGCNNNFPTAAGTGRTLRGPTSGKGYCETRRLLKLHHTDPSEGANKGPGQDIAFVESHRI
jgi:hypothetical protein